MSFLDTILTKRDGGAVGAREIADFVAGVSDESIPDYQISAFLMAVLCRGMNSEETAALTGAMASSGAMLDWDELGRPSADKHSTGGVGDKISLILAPLASACGLAVPMLSGRGLGFTGGTLDKLEAIPGFQTGLSIESFRRQVENIGCGIISQSAEIAPADKKLYALRDVTGTVESLPLIVSSIMSKKIAAGPANLVIDLKVGRGAFMDNLEAAKELGTALRDTALTFGRACSVLFTAMDAPLGFAVGNWAEVEESVDILKGEGPEDCRRLSIVLVAEMLFLAGVRKDRRTALSLARRALDDGQALKVFMDMVSAQGGSLDPGAERCGLAAPPYCQCVEMRSSGMLAAPQAADVGWIAVRLGAGRTLAGEEVDPRAGIRFLRDWGEDISKGDLIACVEGSDRERVGRAAEELQTVLAGAAPEPFESGAVLAVLDEAGWREEDPY